MLPPIVAPMGYPVACSATDVLRHLFDEYSAVMTPTLANMPPMPMPVIARRMPSCTAFCVAAEPSIPTLITSRHSRMMGCRPKRSAKGARKREPAAIPKRPALNSKPSWAPVSFHSAEMGAAVNAMTSTSKPSSMMSMTQTATATHWKRLISPSSSAFLISLTMVSPNLVALFRALDGSGVRRSEILVLQS